MAVPERSLSGQAFTVSIVTLSNGPPVTPHKKMSHGLYSHFVPVPNARFGHGNTNIVATLSLCICRKKVL